MAAAAGVRDRRDHDDRAGQRGEPGPVHQQAGTPRRHQDTRRSGCWPWWPAAPAPSSTRGARPGTRGDHLRRPACCGSLRRGMIVLADRNFARRAWSPRSHSRHRSLTSVRAGRKTGHSCRSPPAAATAPTCHRPGGSLRPRTSTARSPSPPRAGGAPAPTGWPPPCSIPAATRQPSLDAALYHERWEIETLPYLRSNPPSLGGRVLRARTPPVIDSGDLTPRWSPTRSCAPPWPTPPPPSPRHRPRPGQFHHRLVQAAPRPAHPGSRRHRRHRHRPWSATIGRHVLAHLLPTGGCGSAPARRQTSHLQIPGPAAPTSTGPATRPP